MLLYQKLGKFLQYSHDIYHIYVNDTILDDHILKDLYSSMTHNLNSIIKALKVIRLHVLMQKDHYFRSIDYQITDNYMETVIINFFINRGRLLIYMHFIRLNFMYYSLLEL